MARRPGALARLFIHFHTHPHGRIQEFLFWMGLAVLVGGFAYYGLYADWLSLPIALILGVIAITLGLWAFLPQHKVQKPKSKLPERSKRRR